MGDPRLIGIIVGIIILLLGVSFILISDVSYKIEIQDADIPKNTNIELSYEIKNDLFWGEIKNVEFYYWIAKETQPTLYKTHESIKARTSVSNEISIETDDISRGTYTIWTRIDYYRGEKKYSQHLSLNVQIY